MTYFKIFNHPVRKLHKSCDFSSFSLSSNHNHRVSHTMCSLFNLRSSRLECWHYGKAYFIIKLLWRASSSRSRMLTSMTLNMDYCKGKRGGSTCDWLWWGLTVSCSIFGLLIANAYKVKFYVFMCNRREARVWVGYFFVEIHLGAIILYKTAKYRSKSGWNGHRKLF